MITDVLGRLEKTGRLRSCSLTVFHEGAVSNRRFFFGREIVDFNAYGIRFRGGETGYEEFRVPLEDVLEIESGGTVVFRKKPRIEKVYPR